jgi:hypothetical protein
VSEKAEKLILRASSVIGILVLLSWACFRLTLDQPQEFTGKVYYPLLAELAEWTSPKDFFRSRFEEFGGNRRAFVKTEDGWHSFFVTNADYEKISSPDICRQAHSFQATFVAQPLLYVSGYSIAEIKNIQRLNERASCPK